MGQAELGRRLYALAGTAARHACHAGKPLRACVEFISVYAVKGHVASNHPHHAQIVHVLVSSGTEVIDMGLAQLPLTRHCQTEAAPDLQSTREQKEGSQRHRNAKSQNI